MGPLRMGSVLVRGFTLMCWIIDAAQMGSCFQHPDVLSSIQVKLCSWHETSTIWQTWAIWFVMMPLTYFKNTLRSPMARMCASSWWEAVWWAPCSAARQMGGCRVTAHLVGKALLIVLIRIFQPSWKITKLTEISCRCYFVLIVLTAGGLKGKHENKDGVRSMLSKCRRRDDLCSECLIDETVTSRGKF